MKRATLLAGAVALGLSGFGPASQTQTVGSRGDEESIRSLVVVMTEGFNRHDAKAAARMYAPDARFVTVRGEVMNGQPAIEKGLAAILGTRARNASQRTIDVAVRFAAGYRWSM
jgi:ketosteroid isomerase-like protein